MPPLQQFNYIVRGEGVFADDLHYKNLIKIYEDISSLESHFRSTLTVTCAYHSLRAWLFYETCSTSKPLKKPTPFLLLWLQAKVQNLNYWRVNKVCGLGTDLQKSSGCPAPKANSGISRRDVTASMGWRWAGLLIWVHSLNYQIQRARHLATVWWKWHTIKEPEGIACSQETAPGQKLLTWWVYRVILKETRSLGGFFLHHSCCSPMRHLAT